MLVNVYVSVGRQWGYKINCMGRTISLIIFISV